MTTKTDDFTALIDESDAFFAELARNNERAWFEPRKEHYRDRIRRPAELLADHVAQDLGRRTGEPHGSKVFRIHRDVRFSKDKTPYNAHLHIYWSPVDAGPTTPGFFFGSEPGRLVLCLGVVGLKGDALADWRAFVDRDGDDLRAAMDASGGRLSGWGGEPLKRVPSPYAKDHPHGALLRRKGLVLEVEPPEGWREDGLLAALDSMVDRLMPVRNVLTDGL